jgi:tetratricopeptide (TPR) repeat protein
MRGIREEEISEFTSPSFKRGIEGVFSMLSLTKAIFVIIIAISGLFLTPKSYAQWPIIKTDADSLIRLGAGYIYNVEFDKARECFNEVIQRYPDHPAGYFLDAMIEWWKILLYRDTQEFDDAFLIKIEKVIDVSQAILDQNEVDIKGLFFKGGALGFRARYWALRESWIRAASDGHEAFGILMECWKTAPGNHDIMLGTGIYNYFAEAIPEKYPYLQPLLTFLPPGDKEMGIKQLQACSRHALYSGVEAEVVLMQVYYTFEKNHQKAMEMAEYLTEKYPRNPYFQRYLGRTYVINGLADDWEKVWRNILNNYIAKESGYDVMSAREALYYIGMALMRKSNYDMALKYFKKCDEACRVIDDEPSGFQVQANLYIGKIYDKMKKRDLAKKQYERILDWDDYNGSHSQAKRYLKNPY